MPHRIRAAQRGPPRRRVDLAFTVWIPRLFPRFNNFHERLGHDLAWHRLDLLESRMVELLELFVIADSKSCGSLLCVYWERREEFLFGF